MILFLDSSQPILCFETMRKIVLQLKMAEWGIYGIGDGTAGTFLAQHFSTLGPYFGDKDPYNWPHSPFVNEPTQLELKFNEKMIQMTEIVSNGSLQDVSLLDLSAFGSTIAWLNRNHSRESSWPIEMNFEVLKRCQGNCQIMVEEYKTLLDDWKNYMTMVIQNDPHPIFSPLMENNIFFDFTNHIKIDFKTFLIAIYGSQLSPSKNTTTIWRDTAYSMFKNLKDNFKLTKNDGTISPPLFFETLMKFQLQCCHLQLSIVLIYLRLRFCVCLTRLVCDRSFLNTLIPIWFYCAFFCFVEVCSPGEVCSPAV